MLPVRVAIPPLGRERTLGAGVRFLRLFSIDLFEKGDSDHNSP